MRILRIFDFGPRGSPPFFVILNFISSIVIIYVRVKILRKRNKKPLII